MHGLLWLLAALITYGSLYPFNFAPEAATASDVVALLSRLSISLNRGNVVANVLLFLPWGLLTGIAAPARRRPALFVATSVALALLLAVALQVAQLWLPGRNAALGDALINAIGLGLGFLCAAFLSRAGLRGWLALRQVQLVPLLLAGLWIAYRWFPLVPAIDLQNLLDGLKPLLDQPPRLDRVLVSAAGWLACLVLLERSRLLGPGRLWLVGVALGVTAGQPLMAGGAITPSHLLGVALALLLLLLPPSRRPAAAGALLLVALVISGLYPFAWSATPGPFHAIPFAGFLEGSMDTNLLSLVYKSFMYGAAPYLLVLGGWRWRTAMLLTAATLLLVELVQLWLPGRTAELTDPLLAIGLAATLRAASRRAGSARDRLAA